MKALKKVANGATALVLAVSSVLPLTISNVVHADTEPVCAWVGGGDGTSFNDASNWTNYDSTGGCSNSGLPATGDNLAFPDNNLSGSVTLNNNLSNLSVRGIVFNGDGTSGHTYGYTLTGNAITVTESLIGDGNPYNVISTDLTLGSDVLVPYADNGAYVNLYKTSGTQTLNLNGHTLTIGGQLSPDKITGSGTISVSANGYLSFSQSSAASDWSGTLNLASDASMSVYKPSDLGTASIHVADGGALGLCGLNGATINNDLTIAGRGPLYGSTYGGALDLVPACGMGGGSDFNSQANVVWAGAITLTGNTTVTGRGQLKVTGPLSGNYTLAMEPGNSGNIDIESSANTSGTGNGGQTSQTTTTTYSANSPATNIGVNTNNIAIVDGTYNDVIMSGGTLKGTGTIHSLDANSGIVAPGHSPGKLTVQTTFTLSTGATYQAELKDTAAGDFDQIVVGNASDTTGNDVVLAGKLEVQLYSGADIKAGDTFKIIDNLSQTQVSGTFADLPEGATFTVGGGTMKISYIGGDGNDVVLTAMSAIKAPDTGFAVFTSHPEITLLVTFGAALALVGLARTNLLRRQ